MLALRQANGSGQSKAGDTFQGGASIVGRIFKNDL